MVPPAELIVRVKNCLSTFSTFTTSIHSKLARIQKVEKGNSFTVSLSAKFQVWNKPKCVNALPTFWFWIGYCKSSVLNKSSSRGVRNRVQRDCKKNTRSKHAVRNCGPQWSKMKEHLRHQNCPTHPENTNTKASDKNLLALGNMVALAALAFLFCPGVSCGSLSFLVCTYLYSMQCSVCYSFLRVS